MKAVIVDLQGRYAAALTDAGEVVKINNDNYEPGQIIELPEAEDNNKTTAFPLGLKRVRRSIAIAASIAVFATAGTFTAYAMPYGTVNLETDGSIEYTINIFDLVLDVKATDDKGKQLLDEMDVQSLRHKRVDEALNATLIQIEKNGLIDDDFGFRLETQTGNGDHTDRLQQELEKGISTFIPERRPGKEQELSPEDNTQNLPTDDDNVPRNIRPSDSDNGAPDAVPSGNDNKPQDVDPSFANGAPAPSSPGEQEDIPPGESPSPENDRSNNMPLDRNEPQPPGPLTTHR